MSTKGRIERLESQVDENEHETGNGPGRPVYCQPDPSKDEFLLVLGGRNAKIILPHNGREPIPSAAADCEPSKRTSMRSRVKWF